MEETNPTTQGTRRFNPFGLGLIGIILVIAGTLITSQVAADRDAQRIAARLGEAKLQGAGSPDSSAILQKTQNYYRWHQLGELLGTGTFLVGLGLTVMAGVIWYRQAQLPDQEEPEPEV